MGSVAVFIDKQRSFRVKSMCRFICSRSPCYLLIIERHKFYFMHNYLFLELSNQTKGIVSKALSTPYFHTPAQAYQTHCSHFIAHTYKIYQ